jgi:hypothetical protein
MERHPSLRATAHPLRCRDTVSLRALRPTRARHLLYAAVALTSVAAPLGRTADARPPRHADVTLSALPAGSYVAVLANGQKLPWTTTVPAVKGLVHWARLDLAVLRLRADGRYTLSYRYSQDVMDSRAPVHLPPSRDELSSGRYAERGKLVTFMPAPAAKGKKAPQRVTADVVGGDIALDKTVFVGERPFRVRLLFRRDPSLW